MKINSLQNRNHTLLVATGWPILNHRQKHVIQHIQFKSLLQCNVKHNKQISVSEIKVGAGVNYKMNMGNTERLVGGTDLVD